MYTEYVRIFVKPFYVFCGVEILYVAPPHLPICVWMVVVAKTYTNYVVVNLKFFVVVGESIFSTMSRASSVARVKNIKLLFNSSLVKPINSCYLPVQ